MFQLLFSAIHGFSTTPVSKHSKYRQFQNPPLFIAILASGLVVHQISAQGPMIRPLISETTRAVTTRAIGVGTAGSTSRPSASALGTGIFGRGVNSFGSSSSHAVSREDVEQLNRIAEKLNSQNKSLGEKRVERLIQDSRIGVNPPLTASPLLWSRQGKSPSGENAQETLDQSDSFVSSPNGDSPVAFDKSRDGRQTYLRATNAVAGHELTVQYIKLGSAGDAILIGGFDGPPLLIDTGLSEQGYAEIRRHVARMQHVIRSQEMKTRLRVVVTHEHADHLRGLLRLLSDDLCEVDEVVIGVSNPSNPLVNQVCQRLAMTHYPRQLGTPNVLHFVPRNDYTRYEHWGESSCLLDVGDFRVLTLAPTTESLLQIVQYREPASPNHAALIAKLSHNGITQLLTSDLNESVMRNLLRHRHALAPYFELKSDILKWPHHIWLPQTDRTVRRFVQEVQPMNVVISNIGASQKEVNVEGIRQLIWEVLGHPIGVYWTFEDGTTNVISFQFDHKRFQTVAACSRCRPHFTAISSLFNCA